jgi:hypothetical protein
MVFRPVRMTERHIHHLPDDFNRIARFFLQAKADDSVYALGVAFVANIMAIDASGLAHFLLMADFTFHQYVFV